MIDAGTPTHELTIADLALGGDGVGRLPDGRTVFVPFTIPGETVRAAILSEHNRFCRGDALEILCPSPDRVAAPPCPLFGRCGGCQYQHLAYPAQVAAKTAQLRETLVRLGGFADLPAPAAVVRSPQEFGYRNKLRLEPVLRLPLKKFITDSVDYGFCGLDNTTVLPVTACPLAMPTLNELLPVARQSGEAEQNARRREPFPLTLRQPAVGEAVFYFGRGPRETIYVEERVCGRSVSAPLAGFWQVNPAVAAEMIAVLQAWEKDAPPPGVLVDAYAGAGVFSLALGARAARRVVIEAEPASVTAARRNHAAWGMADGTEFITGNTETRLPLWLAKTKPQDAVVVLDPPRGGCDPAVLRALREHPPRRLFYVSCHPATLARDLRSLCNNPGAPYRLRRFALFDMFPQTAHFETAVELEPAAGAAER